VRIVGGRWRGLALAGPAGAAIRPTGDRVRETLFDILAHRYGDPVRGARVIDAFAGTGALGLEALSRGADFCLFVEQMPSARALIRRNIEAAGALGAGRIFRRDATRMGGIGSAAPYTLALLDPPYGRGLGEAALASLAAGGWLAPDAMVVLEEAAASEVALPPGFEALDRRVSGDTALIVAAWRGAMRSASAPH
jgi:16S rRNA (guanine966-N2)-methyltransferase